MNTTLYVGNLPFDATENDLQDLFAAVAPVSNVNLIIDRQTQRPRGFGFVAMATEEGAKAAIESLNGKDFRGRAMTVTEARPREERPAGGGGHGGGRGGGGYGGGRGGSRGGGGGGGRRDFRR